MKISYQNETFSHPLKKTNVWTTYYKSHTLEVINWDEKKIEGPNQYFAMKMEAKDII